MQIKMLKINNHLCLRDFEITFNIVDGGSSTILIGENGTGKTTMLKAILDIIMSFDSIRCAKNVQYDYHIEYEYAQKDIVIDKTNDNYSISVDGELYRGKIETINAVLANNIRIFPERIIAFYSGNSNKFLEEIKKNNRQYEKNWKKEFKKYTDSLFTAEVIRLNSKKRKYIYCDEDYVSIYLCSILAGNDSYEKIKLQNECGFMSIDYVDMTLTMDDADTRFADRFTQGVRYNFLEKLEETVSYIDKRFINVLGHGQWHFTSKTAYFRINGVYIEELKIDSISIFEFFEKLKIFYKAKYVVHVRSRDAVIADFNMSEGQRQLIKILGMLGVCKSEDCLVLMDEPDAHMNPKWKYDIKETIDDCLKSAINTQAIIATHDPLVINGVSKEYIRIFTHNEAVRQNNSFHITQVIEPTEDTAGMGIDGLLQSQYYRLSTSYDKPTFDKFKERQELYIKLINNEISPEEKVQLKQLTKELGALPKSYTTIDFLYDDFIKAYRNSPLYHKEYLSFDELERRRAEIEEIIKALYEAQI